MLKLKQAIFEYRKITERTIDEKGLRQRSQPRRINRNTRRSVSGTIKMLLKVEFFLRREWNSTRAAEPITGRKWSSTEPEQSGFPNIDAAGQVHIKHRNLCRSTAQTVPSEIYLVVLPLNCIVNPRFDRWAECFVVGTESPRMDISLNIVPASSPFKGNRHFHFSIDFARRHNGVRVDGTTPKNVSQSSCKHMVRKTPPHSTDSSFYVWDVMNISSG